MNNNTTNNINHSINSNNMDLLNSKKKQKKMIFLALILVIALAIGYAVLQSQLTILGTTKVKEYGWDVHWGNIQKTSGSVSGEPTLGSDNTEVSFSITLQKPGDFFEFTVDAINEGAIDAKVESVVKKIDNSTSIPAYLIYTVTDSNNQAIEVDQPLPAGTRKTYKVRIEYKEDITELQLPGENHTHTVLFEVNYMQADATPSPSPSVSPTPTPTSTPTVLFSGEGFAGNRDLYILNTPLDAPLYNNLQDAMYDEFPGSPFAFRFLVEEGVIKRVWLVIEGDMMIEGGRYAVGHTNDLAESEVAENENIYIQNKAILGIICNTIENENSIECSASEYNMEFTLSKDGGIEATYDDGDNYYACMIRLLSLDNMHYECICHD